MYLLDKLAEQHIQQARDAGELDDLAGAGAPLPADDMRGVPEALRPGYRMLRNAGCLPPELALRREIQSVHELIEHAEPGSRDQLQAERRLHWLRLCLAETGAGNRALAIDPSYTEPIRRKLAPDSGKSAPHSAR